MPTPVVFVVYNRPELASVVFERIRAARPQRLTIVADGPRADRPGDAERVAATRATIERRLDWSCEVVRDYAETNLGCGRRFATGLDAAFARYDRAIVLEDDTLPEPSFFPFADAMLDRYADDDRVFHVSGANTAVAQGHRPAADGYGFSRFPDIWGWATWSRSWRRFDHSASDWPRVRETGWLETVVPHRVERRQWRRWFDNNHALRPNPRTWDTSWIYACMRHGLSVTPERNLVSNVGCGVDGTNCHHAEDPKANLPTEPIDVERLESPARVEADERLDNALRDFRFDGADYRRRKSIAGRLRRLVNGRAA